MKTFLHFVQWAIQNNLSVDQCFHFDTPFRIEDAQYATPLITAHKVFNKSKEIPECILKNMNEYNTTEHDAYIYETHCHNCGFFGKKYCCDECFIVIENFNYKCFWNTACKMCFIY
jgi:hypothetical protein